MPVITSLKSEWPSPVGGDTLLFANIQSSPSVKEHATHGEVYETGRTRVKLYGGSDGPERAKAAAQVVEPNAGALIRVLRGIAGTRRATSWAPSVWSNSSESGRSSGRSGGPLRGDPCPARRVGASVGTP